MECKKQNPICLSRVKKRFMLIVTCYGDIKGEEGIFPMLFNGSPLNDFTYILLLMGVHGDDQDKVKNIWGQEDINLVRKVKPNVVMKGAVQQFGSEGEVYSFGKNARYDRIDSENILSYSDYIQSKLLFSVSISILSLNFHS